MTKRLAVILSGCGFLDGAEVHESVLSLLAIKSKGADYSCFAPEKDQYHIVSHTSQKETDGKRNCLEEAARIARGDIKPLSQLEASNFDALILPGGFGAAKNLCDFALKGPECSVDPLIEKVIKDFFQKGKSIGAICISPAVVAKVLGSENVLLTIGNDTETKQALEQLGARHQDCEPGDICVDLEHKIVSTPAYMYESSIDVVFRGVDKLVEQVLSF